MENIAWNIIRATFRQERMTYIPEEAEVIYQSSIILPRKSKFL